MANAKIKLTYFDVNGRGDVTRMLLHAAGKDFEDIRVDEGAEWDALKPKTPLGMIPILEIDGKPYIQSHAFNRYLADEFGLGGKTRVESLHADQIALVWDDVFQAYLKGFYEEDAAKKADIWKEMREGIAAKAQAFMENMLKENGKGYLASDRMTIADIYAYDFHHGMMGDQVGPVDKYPLLKSCLENVKANPGIAAFLAKQK